MNKKTKITLAATASLAAAALAFSLPSAAHDQSGAEGAGNQATHECDQSSRANSSEFKAKPDHAAGEANQHLEKGEAQRGKGNGQGRAKHSQNQASGVDQS